MLLGKGLRTTEPFTVLLVNGSKISLKQTCWFAVSGPLQVPFRAALKLPARCATVGTMATVLVVIAV